MHEYHIDTFVMGDDWEGKFDFLKEEGVEVVDLPRMPGISSWIWMCDVNGVFTSQIKEARHTPRLVVSLITNQFGVERRCSGTLVPSLRL